MAVLPAPSSNLSARTAEQIILAEAISSGDCFCCWRLSSTAMLSKYSSSCSDVSTAYPFELTLDPCQAGTPALVRIIYVQCVIPGLTGHYSAFRLVTSA